MTATTPTTAPARPAVAPVSEKMLPPGASHVRTTAFALAQLNASKALELRAVAGFFGEPGTGKTMAMRYFCDNCPVEHLYITASPSPQRKEVFEQILQGLTGTVDNVSARELRWQCNELLAERPRVLVVDEAQHLSTLWHQQLRSLHDHPEATFALLLAGGANAERRLQSDPQLWSRVALRCEFAPLAGTELLNALAAFHPVLANTDDDLLLDIDSRDCRGNFRNWATWVELALGLLPGAKQPDRLTPKVVRAIFAMRGIK